MLIVHDYVFSKDSPMVQHYKSHFTHWANPSETWIVYFFRRTMALLHCHGQSFNTRAPRV